MNRYKNNFAYYLSKEKELCVDHYQGSVACVKLKKDTGVCWVSINQQKTIVVQDVHEFPGHIACDSRSNSLIVVHLKDQEGNIYGVLDVDSNEKNSFCEVYAENLDKILNLRYSL